MADKGSNGEKAELKIKAWSLFKRGWTYREIGKKIGRGRTVVGDYINEELKRLTGEYQHIADDYVRRELESLEDMEKAIVEKAVAGDKDSIALMIKIKERRAKYMALDSPTKVEHSGTLKLEDLVHAEKEETK